ncbi:probable E3 ubiquitin-protein ligase HERC4 isoform X1 [Ischnura elegans]|nr:probable E3 ubiquitin-protein ligase HERC4 isoform X1 [Ischnura elegans]XP_046391940.1 probable E3 ubiquitin-protein ligase HERC4 isoform X1 [Ischnura elegans]XP_046391941.1 probable E3 ubiquitin-protein ligase HERC4 isoform X1 [Ischnura elegans]
MFCWGNTVNGELGLGGIEEEHILTPRVLNFREAANVSHVSCGENHTVMVTDSGEVFTCGSNDYGQLGHDGPRKRPEQVTALSDHKITVISAGATHSVCVNEWGQVFSWGCNLHGQLGNEPLIPSQPTPKIVRSLATVHIVQVASGISHNLAIANNGDLYSWGSNTYGQLGIGTVGGDVGKPQIVKSLAGIPLAFIACGGFHSFAVSKSGAVFGWGKNTFGQLGLGDHAENKSFPTQLKTLRTVGVKYISCGDDFSVFLTKDGGVFTCGLGNYGQLGHNSKSNEVLPRKVMELMGLAVTQISCGRRHTLALVPGRNRLYAFGLGGVGQLGNRLAVNSLTPQLVLGPWLPNNVNDSDTLAHPPIAQPHSSPVLEKATRNGLSFEAVAGKCTVKSIFAGGDQCFMRVADMRDNIPADDYREHDPSTQILTIALERLKECESVPADSTVDLDLISYIETTFGSQACMNGSFLMPGNLHFSCSARHHGIDMSLAQRCFGSLARSENPSIVDVVFNCVSGTLLQSLTRNPPDVETLRVYLVLPLYHGFENAKNFETLQCSFGQSVLGLSTEASKVVDMWWSSASADYFERLVRIFKNVLEYLIKISTSDDARKEVAWNHNIVVGLEILRVLNDLNKKCVGGCKVPYETFYLHELVEKVNLPHDYIRWLTEKSGFSATSVYFCDYPFLFDVKAKTLLLQTDQAMQMQSAVNEAASRALPFLLFGGGSSISQMHFLILEVSRENLVGDTLAQLQSLDTRDLKKPLKVKFLGEEAEDAGGVRKEFFLLVMREVLDPKYGMFQEHEETRAIWFSENSFEDEGMYFLIGLLCGLAIYNFTIIELPFPPALYKKLLGEPVSLNDLEHLSPTMARSLRSLLSYEGPDMEEVFGLTFEISKEVYGEMKVLALKPGGGNIPVTQENKKEYVDLYVDWILNKSVEKHFIAYRTGFLKVCGGRVLKLFHAQELMATVVGNEEYDWDELERETEYKNGYSSSHPTIRLFWEVFHEMPLDQKKKFLLFLTGSDRIPIMGMKAIKLIIQPTEDDKYLPVAHTCFNLLDLPRYATKEKLRYKLMQAIQQCQGFSLV